MTQVIYVIVALIILFGAGLHLLKQSKENKLTLFKTFFLVGLLFVLAVTLQPRGKTLPFVTVKMDTEELAGPATGKITIATTAQEVSILVKCNNQQGILLQRGKYGNYDVKRKFRQAPDHFAPLTVLVPDSVDFKKERNISSWKNKAKLLLTVPIGWTYFDLFKGRQNGVLIEITEDDGAFRKYTARITPEGKVIEFN